MLSAIIMMAVVGALLGAALAFASTVFYVKPDHRVEELTAMLPGYNCGGGGYPGCSGMAAGLVEGEASIDFCKPSKPEVKEAIKKYMEEHKEA